MTVKSPPPPEPLPAESFVLTTPDDPASNKDWYLWAGVLALLVFVVFFPAITGQYIWDDDHHAGLIQYFTSLDGLAKIWNGQATPQYYPLTYTTYWVEHRLWLDNTLGYHLDNLLLHAGSAVLVWRLLRRLRVPGAWVAAAIWAIHPIQAESVCWISERKNVLSGFLFFCSIWFYLEYDGWTSPDDKPSAWLGNKWLAYALSWLFFVLALLSKTVTCAMPAVMLILAWWRGRKLMSRKTLLPLIPFFLAGLAMAVVTVYLEINPTGNVGALGSDWALDPTQRLLIAGRGIWFYAAKLVWPLDLTFSYPRVVPSVEALGSAMYAVQWLYVAGTLAALAALWLGRRRLGRGPLAAVLYYGVTLFPALGFINLYPMRYSFVADHFQYLSGLGLIVLAVAAVSAAMRRIKLPAAATTLLAAAVVAALFLPAWLQAHIYESPVTLWEDTLAKNPDSWMACDNLGVALITRAEAEQRDAGTERMQNDTDSATADEQQAQDDYAQSEKWLLRALDLYPKNYVARNALGLLYRQTGRMQEAEAQLRIAVDLDEQEDKQHQLVAPYLTYAEILGKNHPDADIQPWIDKALEIAAKPHAKPTDMAMTQMVSGEYWVRRAGFAAQAGKTDEEVADLNRAIDALKPATQTVPDDIGGLFNLAQAYERLGLIDQQRADKEREAGHLDAAAEFERKSHLIDDDQALKAYLGVVARVPFGRNAAALEGIGKLYFSNIVVQDNQPDALHDLLLATQFFIDAIKIDPTLHDAPRFLPLVSRQLLEQGQKALAHPATWTPLRVQLQPLAGGAITKSSAADADRAAQEVLWPLAKTDELRPALIALRSAIADYLDPDAPADAAKGVRAAAADALPAMSNRNEATDQIADISTAATCFEGAVTADEHSAEAWNLLNSTAAALRAAPGTDAALKVALSVLDQHRAATQPTTEPSQAR
jgi:protein O-mannosyl-transferase